MRCAARAHPFGCCPAAGAWWSPQDSASGLRVTPSQCSHLCDFKMGKRLKGKVFNYQTRLTLMTMTLPARSTQFGSCCNVRNAVVSSLKARCAAASPTTASLLLVSGSKLSHLLLRKRGVSMDFCPPQLSMGVSGHPLAQKLDEGF